MMSCSRWARPTTVASAKADMIAMRFVHALQQAGIIGQPALNERGNYVWFDDYPHPTGGCRDHCGDVVHLAAGDKMAAYSRWALFRSNCRSKPWRLGANMALSGASN